jgi:hypothetical protein
MEPDYRTYGGFLRSAAERARRGAGGAFEIPSLALFCFAMRREVHRRVGDLDESFGIGTLEDDDYGRRLAAAGYTLLCAKDVLVHRFGRASFGELVPGGERSAAGSGSERSTEPAEREWSADPAGRERSTDPAGRELFTASTRATEETDA